MPDLTFSPPRYVEREADDLDECPCEVRREEEP